MKAIQIALLGVLLLCTVAVWGQEKVQGALLSTSHNPATSMNEVLEKKWQDMAAIACLEAKGDIARIDAAIRRGLDDGLTVNQIKEALSHLYAYTGFPRSLNALGMLQRVLEARRAAGIVDTEGPDAYPLPADYDALRQGTEVQCKLTGRGFNYTFAPATDYYLKAHLFGDIFARNTLSHAERELVTIGALSGLPGAEAQLRAHVEGARNMSLADDTIRAIPDALQRLVGDVEGYRARRAVADVFGLPFTDVVPLEPSDFPKGEPNTAYAQYFTGNSYLARLTESGLPISNVTFEPRCRNHWHMHHKTGQTLICVNGRGWYQAWGEQPRELRPGDVVNIPAEVKHWHGAARDSWFQHIAFSIPVDGATTEWAEEVTDAEYDRLP